MSAGLRKMKLEMIEWGLWSRSSQLMGSLSRGSAVYPQITDERALQISRVVGTMRNREKEFGRTLYPKGRNAKAAPFVSVVLMSTYVNQMTIREVSRLYDINRDKADKIINFGVESVFKALDAANDD